MLVTFRELIDVVIMTFAVGYIFIDVLVPRNMVARFSWRRLWLSTIVTAPGIIAHELAHKFVALAYGMLATFHAAYVWLGIGVVLKLVSSPLIFFVPGYVQLDHAPTPLAGALVAFAGPFLNFALFATAWFVLRKTHLSRRAWAVWYLTKQINLFLFVFNMLPIFGFDGLKVYEGLYRAFLA
ncbi:M50 family metallopeptidase [Candidatus Woesearchaeota archaeon]|nr:M50 family metallopeptidase [Candidatus Woesearchaeota archaeon]